MRNNYLPSRTSPAGASIVDALRIKGLTIEQFANKCDLDCFHLERILSGDDRVDSQLAEKLSDTFGGSIEFWLDRDDQYYADLINIRKHIAELENLDWKKKFPIKEMLNRGWFARFGLNDGDVLGFFNIDACGKWEEINSFQIAGAAFRTSAAFKEDGYALSAWLRFGELIASQISLAEWDKEKLVESIPLIRSLSMDDDFKLALEEVKKILANCGVAFVLEKGLPGCRASGIAKRLNSQKSLIIQSGRFKTNDHFWFTLFHEIGHLILHTGEKIFYEYESSSYVSSLIEDEANDFASKVLIPACYDAELMSLKHDYRSIIRFAKKIRIAPGIIVGQLQFRGILPVNYLNKLKAKIVF